MMKKLERENRKSLRQRWLFIMVAIAFAPIGTLAHSQDNPNSKRTEGGWCPTLSYVNGMNTTIFSAYRQAIKVRSVSEESSNFAGVSCDFDGGTFADSEFALIGDIAEWASERRWRRGRMEFATGVGDNGENVSCTKRRNGNVSCLTNSGKSITFAATTGRVISESNGVTDEIQLNRSHNVAYDAIETALMLYTEDEYLAVANAYVDALYFRTPKFAMGPIVGFTASKILLWSASRARYPEDLRRLEEEWVDILFTAPRSNQPPKNLLHIGYSQGGVYGNLIYQEIFGNRKNRDYGGRFFSVLVATPLGESNTKIPGQYFNYVTIDGDSVINKLRDLPLPDPFMPNAINTHCLPLEWESQHAAGHELIGGYIYDKEKNDACEPEIMQSDFLLRQQINYAMCVFHGRCGNANY